MKWLDGKSPVARAVIVRMAKKVGVLALVALIGMLAAADPQIAGALEDKLCVSSSKPLQQPLD